MQLAELRNVPKCYATFPGVRTGLPRAITGQPRERGRSSISALTATGWRARLMAGACARNAAL